MVVFPICRPPGSAGSQLVLTDGRTGHLGGQKPCFLKFLRNISKTTQYFFLIVSGPHRRVLKTYSGSYRIGKIGKFSSQKSRNVFDFLIKIWSFRGQKIKFFEDFSKTI